MTSTEARLTNAAPETGCDTGLLTILFVDDEPNVLQGLRRSTRRMRDRWDMHFADNGAAGLELLGRLGRVDVVVSDMRMPGMDGAEFLTEVRARQPQAARIILSGQSDHEGVLRAIGAAHQYLAKPCDTDELASVVERIRSAGSHVLHEPVSTLVGQADRLPTSPDVFQRLGSLLSDEKWSLDEVSALISEDVALTTETLKLVNSAFFGLSTAIDSVQRAVSFLGVEMVQGVILSNKVFEANDDLASWINVELLGARSRAVAAAARGLALREGAPRSVASEAFLAGMVSEVGLLVMARLPGVDGPVAQSLNSLVDDGIERAMFGGNRFRVGAHLLSLWGFDEDTVSAIGQLGEAKPESTEGLAWYLLAARHLVLQLGFDPEEVADPSLPMPELSQALEAIRTGDELLDAGSGGGADVSLVVDPVMRG